MTTARFRLVTAGAVLAIFFAGYFAMVADDEPIRHWGYNHNEFGPTPIPRVTPPGAIFSGPVRGSEPDIPDQGDLFDPSDMPRTPVPKITPRGAIFANGATPVPRITPQGAIFSDGATPEPRITPPGALFSP